MVKAFNETFKLLSFESKGIWVEDHLGCECFLNYGTFSLLFHPVVYYGF
jgi:hypothetical protein